MTETIALLKEWLNGTAKPMASGGGIDGPSVQLQRPNGKMACLTLRFVSEELIEAEKREIEYMSIFRRCCDIVAFHAGDDGEKVEAIRKTMLQVPHLK